MLLLVSASAVGPVRAGPADCAAMVDSVQKDCRLAAAVPKPGSGELTPPDIGAPVEAPLSADSFRPTTADALAADPSTLLHRPIAVAPARCFYFGVGDYRCALDGAKPAVISASIVIPPEAEVAVEHGCDGSAAGGPPGCSHRLMFVPGSVRTVEVEGRDVLLFRSNNVILDTPGSAPADVSCPARASKEAASGCRATP